MGQNSVTTGRSGALAIAVAVATLLAVALLLLPLHRHIYFAVDLLATGFLPPL